MLFIAIIIFSSFFSCVDPKLHSESHETTTSAETAFRPVEVGERYIGESNDLLIGSYSTIENGGLPYCGIVLPNKIYRIDAGDTFDEIEVATFSEHTLFDSREHTVDITVREQDLVSVEILDPYLIIGRGMGSGGLSVTGIQPGVAHIYIKLTHIPTGGSETLQLIVIVRDPAETTE